MSNYDHFRCKPRLPKFANPKTYDLHLKPDLTACKFTGTVNIRLDIVADTKFIVLNAADLSVDPKSVRFQSETGSKGFEAVNVELLVEDEVLVLEFAENLPRGVGVLFIKFDGTLNDQMKGFYRR
ncbi:putative membrane alanyl aminopeptidase [Helianthus annuus]|nr:putative membrane alanyl aminopeptidase [Helianthus annuus]